MFATKIAMTQIFDQNGRLVPVTVLRLEKNLIVGKRTTDKDGHSRSIVALIDEKAKTKKSVSGQFKGMANIKRVLEIQSEDSEEFKLNEEISIDSFKEGETLRIESVSKGKGFAGTVKRHSFHTGPKTHGSHNYRQPGSIGDTGPQRVKKGMKMSGHMGHVAKVTKNVVILRVEEKQNQIWVRGPIPGPNKSTVIIQK